MRLHHLGGGRLPQLDHLSFPILNELRKRRPLNWPIVEAIDAGEKRCGLSRNQSLRWNPGGKGAMVLDLRCLIVYCMWFMVTYS
jgi:hypothetical protein